MKNLLEKRFSKENKDKYMTAVILSLAASFMIGFYAPMELFSNNLDEFLFDVTAVLPVSLLNFCIGFAISLLVCLLVYLINEKLYGGFILVYFVAFICSYIQGNFFVDKIPVLDGTDIDWSVYRAQNIKTTVMWMAVIMVVCMLYRLLKMKRLYKVVTVVSALMLAMLAVSILWVSLSKGAYEKDENNMYVTNDSMLEVSEDKNFIILLLDCVDATDMNEVIKANPEYKEVFKNFTYFTNTASAYPYTSQSIPFILTGQWYENEQSYQDYCQEAFNNSPLFAELEKRDYSIGLYEADLPELDRLERYENIYDMTDTSIDTEKLAALELKSTFFRYTPYFMKKLFVYDNSDFKEVRESESYSSQSKVFSSNDLTFYKYITSNEMTKRDGNSFKFIHIDGAHSPFRYNEKVQCIDNATYHTNIQACVTITEYYINMLKESGVYDDSVILVMSDHGYEGGYGQGEDRQNPILFVKGAGESHELLYDDAPISHEDLQEAYVRLLDGKTSDEIFDYKEGDKRERRYLLYALRDKNHMYEFKIEKHASIKSESLTGNVYIREENTSTASRIAEPFENVLKWLSDKTGNFGVAIIIFTLLTKLVLLPLSIWVQFNSIKMVEMQPEINSINIKYYGDKETISEKQAELYKAKKYNPLLSVVPMVVQLLLLMVVIDAIKGVMYGNISLNTYFLVADLRIIPRSYHRLSILSPVFAALSAWVMCYAQNKSNVLQHEQGKLGKYGAMLLSILLSLYLGWFVSIGVVVYWISSNLMSVAQLYILNYFINPTHYVDYASLRETQEELDRLRSIGSGKDAKALKKYSKLEKESYKRFFSVTNKHLVFYSENTGFYKYYKGIIEYLLEHTNLTIHYITSDPEDAIFELARVKEAIQPYYISEKKLITLFMKMEADVVIMTMPDLENFHIKRSYVRDDIEYIFIPHSMDSLNMTMRGHCMDHYDTVFCVGPHQKEEIQKNELAYDTRRKKLIDWGYCLLDEMIEDYNNSPKTENEQKTIMIAPSWQEGNIVDSCLEQLLDELKEDKYNVIVRPHPQHVRHKREYMEILKDTYKEYKNITIQTDFSSNSDVFNADLLITDWSGISYEYAYATRKPVLHINTPMKVMNPEYQTIDTVPINILVRDEIGCSVDTDKLDTLRAKVHELMENSDKYSDKISGFVSQYVYNLGDSAKVGAEYIFAAVKEKVDERKKQEADKSK